MTERKQELMQYIKTLMQLKECGIKCDNKIEIALNELHSEMGFIKYGIGNINNITINKLSDESAEEVVDNIMKNLKRMEEENTLSWSKATDSITSTSDGGIKIAGTIKMTEAENPFDTIE